MKLFNLEVDSTVDKSSVFLTKFGHKLLLFLCVGLIMCESVGKNNCYNSLFYATRYL